MFRFLLFILFLVSSFCDIYAVQDPESTKFNLLNAIDKCDFQKIRAIIEADTLEVLEKTGNSVSKIPESLYYSCKPNVFCSILPLLVKKGSDINKKTGSGDTLLHNAIRQSNEIGLRCLLANGADPNIRIKMGKRKGKSPIQLAKRLKKRKIYEILTSGKLNKSSLDEIFKKENLSKSSAANSDFSLFSSLGIRKKLPSELKTNSQNTVIWQAREIGKPIEKVLCLDKMKDELQIGTPVTITSFVFADLMKKEEEMAQPCGKKYIRYKDRPKRKEELWVKITYLDKNFQKTTGYTSISNFQTTSIPNKDYKDIFQLAELDTHGMLWGSKRWKLPIVTKPSYLDVLGWQNYLVKQILDNNDVVISRDELEYFVEISKGYQLKYIRYPQRIPEHFGSIPPLIQPISFEPTINFGVVYADKIVFISVSKLEPKTFFYYPPFSGPDCSRSKKNCTYVNPIPLRFRFPNKFKNNPLMLLLLSKKAFLDLQKKEQKIIVNSKKSYRQEGCLKVTDYESTVDFDTDGMPEINYNKEDYRLIENCQKSEEERDYQIVHIAMHHNGKWYRTAYSALGQDGPEGF